METIKVWCCVDNPLLSSCLYNKSVTVVIYDRNDMASTIKLYYNSITKRCQGTRHSLKNKNNSGQLKYIFYFSISFSFYLPSSSSLFLSPSLSFSPPFISLFLSLWPVKRVCTPCSLVREREKKLRERGRGAWTNTLRREIEIELYARASRKCRHAIIVPHSVSQSACVIILYTLRP